MRHLVSFLLLLLAALSPLRAQEDVVYRLELGGGFGANFGLNDLNSKFYGKTGLGASLLARFPLNPRSALKVSAAYGALKGTTVGLTDDFYPALPNAPGQERLAFEMSSGVVDLSGLYELHFLPYGFYEGYQGYRRLVPYIQMGFGLAYGLEGRAFTAQVPVGVGLKYKIAPRLNLGLDWTMHFTLTDKLDALTAPKGIKTSGFRGKDHYSLTLLTLTYDLAPLCPTCNKD